MRAFRTLRLAACVCLAGGLTAGTAHANLITNGDFGTGDLTGWTNVGGNSVVGSDASILPGGSNFAVLGLGSTSGMRSIAQDFNAPTEDHSLMITFDFGFNSTMPISGDTFANFVNIDGFDTIQLQSITTSAVPILFSGTVNVMFDVSGASANAPNATLSFVLDDQSGFSVAGVDNVVVTAEINGPDEILPLPEPETWVLFGMGLIGLRYLRRRRTA